MTGLLFAMDRYDLYGRLAIPKRHRPDVDIPVLYRLVAARRGVFVNPALEENFGITLLEASSYGLPVVSTDHGGPQEIISKVGSGELIDARDRSAIQSAIKGILVDRERWERYSENGVAGVREHYSWQAHVERYVAALEEVMREASPARRALATWGANLRRQRVPEPPERSAAAYRVGMSRGRRTLVSDVDGTLLDGRLPGEGAAELGARLVAADAALVLCSGRSLELALAAAETLSAAGLPWPSALVCGVGTE